MTIRSCTDLLAGHRHCKHGHVRDCPTPEECDIIEVGGTRRLRPTPYVAERHDYEPGETTHPMHTDPNCRVCGEVRH